MTVEPYGKEYLAEEWPHGLRCLDCNKLLQEGDRYATRLIGMTELEGQPAPIAEAICLECALGGNDADR